MATSFEDFWADPRSRNQVYGGMLDLGIGAYGMQAGRKEAAQRLAETPYADFNTASRTALSRAGSMDPRAAGQERFNAAQGLLAGSDAKSLDDLMRRLYVNGQSGIASYSGQQGGPAVNPQMQAYFKAKADRDAKLAYDSLNEGEAQIDRQLNRSGMLQRTAGGLRGEMPQPSRSTTNMNLLRGAAGVLKDTGMLPGMISTGKDWLSGMFGGGQDFSDLAGGFDLDWGF
jgi:hypothetical protein